MGDVVDLFPPAPTSTGEAVCMACRATWVAVAPSGTAWLECPACGCSHGHFKYPFLMGEWVWTCACGNDLFGICEAGPYCPACGALQQPT